MTSDDRYRRCRRQFVATGGNGDAADAVWRRSAAVRSPQSFVTDLYEELREELERAGVLRVCRARGR